VGLGRTDVSEERIASILRVTRIGEIGTMLAVTSNQSTQRRNTNSFHIVFLRSVLQFLVTANIVPISQILVTLMMEALSFSDMSVLTKATRCNIPEDGIRHSHRHEIQKSSIALTGWNLQRRLDVSPVRY
jgi:hypothetical protein